MFHHRHASFFPFVIALLTLGLGTLMFVTLNRSVPRQLSSESVAPVVSDSGYREQSHAVIAPFLTAYQSAETDIMKLVEVEDALSALTGLTVPATYRDVQLGLAVSLTLMRDGLRGEDGSLESGFAKLMRLVGDYPWLAE
ncbi:hypothetical protein A2348_00315 [Candidatus Uhrbacteria bacterium RIFOXYB12_FULL_58_10]|uniref:Uncharacterized protein n=1 Tax=Candidatus Uhrbacteria bacterium RIFOXYB2_FULL_57_15 TaxID=1802422 RepID=A0A1F7W8D5_9BACT|nr:MAG: hypothetical protein A2348_00315 [Candidatus Uhrbacteria bacterium RIFOXYB12_FULL_58_10]OGL98354.1 MAG: hypothetical protein A2304_01505 [Candidatus Uhrbacteria bacterium RIFOXYB2_FULL_57_15]OGM00191.1 MAG: hypothetical protein A2501_01450 [Candidatus Uhrbacteria bacterium RIFOXYC12_FULL_57_11]